MFEVLTDLYSRLTCDPRQSDVLERLAGEASDLCAQAEAHDVQVAGVHGATVVQEVDEAREEASDGQRVVGSRTVPGGGGQRGPVHDDHVVVSSRQESCNTSGMRRDIIRGAPIYSRSVISSGEVSFSNCNSYERNEETRSNRNNL